MREGMTVQTFPDEVPFSLVDFLRMGQLSDGGTGLAKGTWAGL